jgi:hypothetical protein
MGRYDELITWDNNPLRSLKHTTLRSDDYVDINTPQASCSHCNAAQSADPSAMLLWDPHSSL